MRHARDGAFAGEGNPALLPRPRPSGKDVGRMKNSSLGVPNISAYVEER